jgi:hypothetical protein
VTQRIGPALLPGLAWLAVMVLAADQRTEGDLLIPTTNPMGVATLLVGAMAWGIAAYRSIATSNQQR